MIISVQANIYISTSPLNYLSYFKKNHLLKIISQRRGKRHSSVLQFPFLGSSFIR